MKIQRFEEIIAWQKAIDLAVIVYQQFEKTKDATFRAQMCKTTVDVARNISDGYNKRSRKEFSMHLLEAKAASDQVKALTYLAHRLSHINDAQADAIHTACDEVSKVIYGLRKAMQPKKAEPAPAVAA